MKRQLGPEAFSIYASLGVARSYSAVAKHFEVSKASVTRLAAREQWPRQLAELERKERESATQRAAETLTAIRERHLKTFRAIQHQALTALQSLRLDSAMSCVRALAIAVEGERLVLGEPTDRTAIDQTTKVTAALQHQADLRRLTPTQRALLRQLMTAGATAVAAPTVRGEPTPGMEADDADEA